jgi:hypothetical protein
MDEGSVDAAKYLLDQRFGRPHQRVELTGEDGAAINVTVAAVAGSIAAVFGGGSTDNAPVPDAVATEPGAVEDSEQGEAGPVLDDRSV